MPIYEYRCEHCQERFEVLQKFNDQPLTECILCRQGPVKKLMSASAFVLKGPGFYVNDYPSDSRKKADGSAKPSAGKSTSPGASSSSSKDNKESSSSDSSSAGAADASAVKSPAPAKETTTTT